MTNAYPKKLNGLCIGVLSGDRVLFQGPPDKENGGFKQKYLILTGISAPKIDSATGNDEKFGFAAREFLRQRLVGKTLPFVIQKKVNETELGYVLYEEKDIIIDLLSNGLAKLRGDKIFSDHIEDYRDAEVEAQMAERGMWSEENKPEGAYRFLKKTWTDKDFFEKFKGQKLRALVEQIHPSKAILYFPDEGFLTTLTFSEVQVVVLSQKLQNGQSKSNVRAIRSVLQSEFLHRDVSVNITTIGQGLQGYIVNKGEQDVRKLLLKNGFAKLGKDAISGISTKEFMQLKLIAQNALQENKGLWKEQKVNKGETLNSKSYMAIVSEIHSGDSLTVFNQDKNQFSRIYLPNIRAPMNNQPFAYESKQALRRRIIGNRVRVEVEFSRKINVKKFQGDVGELKNFIFASVFDNNNNVSVYLLQSGYVSLQTPRVEEDVTKYFEDLRDAEAKGKKDKRGQYGNNELKSPNFNDLSGGKGKKVDASKCKNIYPFLKDATIINGVVDLVLNGSRFKVRFNNQHVLAIVVLEGVRCLPNEGQFAKASEEALQYSKLNASQRDIEIQLKSVDLKGIFHAKIYINKKDYALQLLEKGLAVCMGGKFKNPKYDDSESFARKNKFGLWKYNMNLNTIRGEIEKEYKPINFNKTLIITEIYNAGEFYLQPANDKKPIVPQNPQPATNVVVGNIYAGKFSSDEQYYRAKILKQVGGGKYHVQYIDFGNYQTIPKASLGDLPQNLKNIKSSIYRCSLYGVDSITAEGLSIIKDYINVELKVEFKEQSQPQGKEDIDYRVILNEKNKDSINLELLQYGQAECSCDNVEWRKTQEKARQLREGKWANDDTN